MKKLYSQLVGLPVMEEATFSPVALVRDLIIDPENGVISAFIISGGRIILPMDVLRVTNAMYIKDREHISEVSDILRVQEVLKRNVPILGAKVRNQKKLLLGKVVDYEIDTKSMSLSHIFTAKTFFFFHFQERAFAHSHIIKISEEGITVKDDAQVRVKQKVTAPSSALGTC